MSSTETNLQKEGSKKSKRRKVNRKMADLEEERRLTAMLFGETTTRDGSDAKQPPIVEQIISPDAPLFEIDRGGSDDSHKDTDAPAWVDDNDKEFTVNLMETSRLRKLQTNRNEVGATALAGTELQARLRRHFVDTNAVRTDWATVPTHETTSITTDAGDEFLNTSALLLNTQTQTLRPTILDIVRCPDANQMDPNKAAVQVVHFHPASDPDRPLMLTAGLDKTLRFFQVDQVKSEKVHGIYFPKLPIYSAQFLGSSGNVVVSGRRPFFYLYDAVAGKLDLVPKIVGREEKSLERLAVSPDGQMIAFYGNDGYVILVDARTKQWIADLKMNGSVRALTFTPDGEYLLGSGSDGDVYRWQMSTRQCVERFSNQDGTITSSLAASSTRLAVGAESGVVNLYSQQEPSMSSIGTAAEARTPIKSIMNLHTSADLVRFSDDGQILAMTSRREKNSCKLVHVPTATVFSNWPTFNTPLHYVWSLDFSPKSKFLAIGNDQGKCLLYNLTNNN